MRFPHGQYAKMVEAERAEFADTRRDAKMSAAEKKQVIEESAIEDVVEEQPVEDTPEDQEEVLVD